MSEAYLTIDSVELNQVFDSSITSNWIFSTSFSITTEEGVSNEDFEHIEEFKRLKLENITSNLYKATPYMVLSKVKSTDDSICSLKWYWRGWELGTGIKQTRKSGLLITLKANTVMNK